MDNDFSLTFVWGAFSRNILTSINNSSYSLIDLIFGFDIDLNYAPENIESNNLIHLSLGNIFVLSAFTYDYSDLEPLNFQLDCLATFGENVIPLNVDIILESDRKIALTTMIFENSMFSVNVDPTLSPVKTSIKFDYLYSKKLLKSLELPINISFTTIDN